MTDSREMRAVPLGLTATYAPPTQGSDKARETRLVSPLGFDGAVPLGRIQTRRQSSVPKTNADPGAIISPEGTVLSKPGARQGERREP